MKTFLIYNLLKTFTIKTIVVPSLSFIVTTITTIKSTLFGVVFVITEGISKPVWGSTVGSRFFSWLWVFQAFASTAIVGVALHFVITTIASIKSALRVVVFVITEIVTGPLGNGTLHWSFGCWFRGIKTFTFFAIIVPSICGIFLATVTTIKLTFWIVIDIITVVVSNPTSITIYWCLSWCLGSWFRGIKTFTCLAISVPSFSW